MLLCHMLKRVTRRPTVFTLCQFLIICTVTITESSGML